MARSLTWRFLGAKVKLQVQVFHHVTQLVIVRVFSKLQAIDREMVRAGRAQATSLPLRSILKTHKEIGPRRSKRKARARGRCRQEALDRSWMCGASL